MRAFISAIVAGLLVGCGEKSGETQGSASTGEDTGVATDGGSNTSAPASATDVTTTDGTTTEPGTGTGSTGGEPTTGGAGGYDEACAAWCAFFAGCGFGTTRGCIDESCERGIEPGSACEAAWIEAFTCFTALTCAELRTEGDDCDAKIDAAGDMCEAGPGNCGEGGFGIGGGACELSEPCPDHVRRLFCMDGVCTCFEDDVVVAECRSEDVCQEIDAVDAVAMSCCGWDLLDGEPG